MPEQRPPGPGRVFLDVQGAQSHGYRERGISRHVAGLAAAVAGLEPDLLAGLLVNPALAWPANLADLGGAAAVLPADEVAFERGHVLHIPSPYELGLPVERLVPAAAERAGVKLVVTIHDLIPEVFADVYLEDPGLRLRYRARHQLIRQADAVIAVSEATRHDALKYLGLDPDRVHVIGGGVSPWFVPPESREAARAAVAAAVPGLGGPFVLYTGATDPRKNLDGLLRAWAVTPEGVRRRFQLVVACALKPLERNHLELTAGELGIADELVLTGLVTDDTLRSLYQATDLFVFPSLYEGYGLPVAEALACGAPVVAADNSCLPELVGPPALFDPAHPADIAAAITRALTDDHVRQALLAQAKAPPVSWTAVAEQTVALYRRVLAQAPRPRRAPRPAAASRRVAVVTPLPPQSTPAAEVGYGLLDGLRRHGPVHAYVDGPRSGPAQAPPDVTVRPAHAFTTAEAAEGPYDTVIYVLADSEHHVRALTLLSRRPGRVVALDSRFPRLYQAASDEGSLLPENPFRIGDLLYASYPGQLPPGLAAGDQLTADEAGYWGILFSRPVTVLSERHFTTGPAGATLARLDAPLAHQHKVRSLTGDDPAGWAAELLR